MSRPAAEAIRKGSAALAAMERGEPTTDARLIAAIEAMEAMAALHRNAGLRDAEAGAATNRARLIRMLAEVPNRADPAATLRAALKAAEAARNLAISAAETGGVNDANLSAYVLATNEAALCQLELGRKDASAEGTARLDEAAGYFGEVATGERRLGLAEQARTTDLKALEARGLRALRDMEQGS
jgi:hypothetical protein